MAISRDFVHGPCGLGESGGNSNLVDASLVLTRFEQFADVSTDSASDSDQNLSLPPVDLNASTGPSQFATQSIVEHQGPTSFGEEVDSLQLAINGSSFMNTVGTASTSIIVEFNVLEDILFQFTAESFGDASMSC